MLEARIEDYLSQRVIDAGGMVAKMVPVVAGLPDRLVILPGGVIKLVELKSPTGRLRPVQVAWHKKAAKRGVRVPVLSSRAEVDQFMKGEGYGSAS